MSDAEIVRAKVDAIRHDLDEAGNGILTALNKLNDVAGGLLELQIMGDGNVAEFVSLASAIQVALELDLANFNVFNSNLLTFRDQL